MKQLRNIVAPIFLLCLMAVASLPALAQCKRDRVRTYWRLIRMAYHNVG